MKEIFVLGRVLLGSYFVFSGFHHFTDTAMMTHFASAKGVPMPHVAVVGAGILLVIAGVSLLLGWAPKVGIAATALFLVPVTLMMHQFWNAEGAARATDLINFTKNVGLLGAVLMLGAVPEPWSVSVDARLSGLRGRVRGRVHALDH
jgi:putative oxidoreductase